MHIFSFSRSVPHDGRVLEQQKCFEKKCQVTARRVVLLLLINPATVSFGTAYSESMFAALVFTGAALVVRGGSDSDSADDGDDDRGDNIDKNSGSNGTSMLLSWLAALATRSNDRHAVYMLLCRDRHCRGHFARADAYKYK
jgi:hypothetical protein